MPIEIKSGELALDNFIQRDQFFVKITWGMKKTFTLFFPSKHPEQENIADMKISNGQKRNHTNIMKNYTNSLDLKFTKHLVVIRLNTWMLL